MSERVARLDLNSNSIFILLPFSLNLYFLLRVPWFGVL